MWPILIFSSNGRSKSSENELNNMSIQVMEDNDSPSNDKSPTILSKIALIRKKLIKRK